MPFEVVESFSGGDAEGSSCELVWKGATFVAEDGARFGCLKHIAVAPHPLSVVAQQSAGGTVDDSEATLVALLLKASATEHEAAGTKHAAAATPSTPNHDLDEAVASSATNKLAQEKDEKQQRQDELALGLDPEQEREQEASPPKCHLAQVLSSGTTPGRWQLPAALAGEVLVVGFVGHERASLQVMWPHNVAWLMTLVTPERGMLLVRETQRDKKPRQTGAVSSSRAAAAVVSCDVPNTSYCPTAAEHRKRGARTAREIARDLLQNQVPLSAIQRFTLLPMSEAKPKPKHQTKPRMQKPQGAEGAKHALVFVIAHPLPRLPPKHTLVPIADVLSGRASCHPAVVRTLTQLVQGP